MPCNCDQCLRHARTLGLSPNSSSKEAIHKAYRDAAKIWHPDRFESDPHQLPEAEEHFKQVHIAYRALTEHHEHPVEFAPETISSQPAPTAPSPFGNLPGCFTAPHFPAHVEQIIATHLAPDHTAVAIVDLSRMASQAGDFSQFILLAGHAALVRDDQGIVSILWYADLGEIKMFDQRRRGSLGLWQRLLERLSGPQQKYSLQIYRRSGALFYSITGQTDDSAKKVIYNFLLRKKYQAHP